MTPPERLFCRMVYLWSGGRENVRFGALFLIRIHDQ